MGGGEEFVGAEAVMLPRKPVASLAASDFETSPVWEFVDEPSDNEDEPWVSPVLQLPVDDLAGRIIATRVTLADGSEFAAVLGNVDLQHPRRHAQFVEIKIENEGKWFFLPRYHDENWDAEGPEALARFLERRIDQVFPISYDIAPFASGVESTVRGLIQVEPSERLSDAELMDLILE